MRAIKRLMAAAWVGLAVAGMAQAADMSVDAHRVAARAGALREAEMTLGEAERPAADQLVAEARLLPATKRRERLDAALEIDPENLVAVLLRAEVEVQLGDASAALPDLDRVIAETPNHGNAFVFTLRSEALIPLKRGADAVADAERAMAADGDYSDARLARGWARYSMRDFEAARSDIDKVIAIDPEDGVAALRLGLVLGASGQSQPAVVDSKKSVDLGPLIAMANALIALDPHYSQAWSHRADVNLKRGHLDEAIADATEALDMVGSDDAHADACLFRAKAWFKKGDDARFLADLDQGSALQPKRSELIAMRAVYDMSRKQWPQAKATLTQALGFDPGCAGCLLGRALAEAHLGERALAVADADAGVALSPKEAPSHSVYGEVLQILGDQAGAIKQFDAALAISPEDDSTRFMRAFSQAALGDRAGAVKAYTALLERGRLSSPGEVFFHRGIERFFMGDMALAADDFRSATAAMPHDADSPRNLGAVLEMSGDLSGAADAYRQSLERAPNPAVSASLGRLLMLSGRFAEALDPLRTGLRTSPSPTNYMSLEIYLVRVHAQPSDEPDARTELAAAAHAHDPREWSDSLVDHVLGRIDATALLQRAEDGPADKLRGQRCEADYYVAEVHLARGQREQALPLLAESVKICPPTFFEAGAAKAELRWQATTAASR